MKHEEGVFKGVRMSDLYQCVPKRGCDPCPVVLACDTAVVTTLVRPFHPLDFAVYASTTRTRPFRRRGCIGTLANNGYGADVPGMIPT